MKTPKIFKQSASFLIISVFSVIVLAEDESLDEVLAHEEMHSEFIEDDIELLPDVLFSARACTKATQTQISTVNVGNSKRDDFI